MMKRLCITYHMYRNYPRKEIAETCITLPMTPAIADDIIQNGEDSKYLSPAMADENMSVSTGGVIYEALCRLAEMQGYHFCGVCSVEENP